MPTVRSEHHVTNNLSPAHRQLSTDSVSSLASQLTNLSSTSSSSPQAANGGAGSAQMAIPSASSPSPSPSLKKKSWLRNSFSKAFSRSKRGQSSSRGGSDTEDSGPVSTWSAPSSPLLASHHPHHPSIHSQSTHSSLDESASTPEMVDELKKQLREKDMVLTDIRLEALSSAHQLEALKETVSRMRVSPRFSFSALNAERASDSFVFSICSLPLSAASSHFLLTLSARFASDRFPFLVIVDRTKCCRSNRTTNVFSVTSNKSLSRTLRNLPPTTPRSTSICKACELPRPWTLRSRPVT
jgi:hypothetical protein